MSWSIYFGRSREGVRGISAKWGKKYPHVVKSWETNWEVLTAFFRYPLEIRRVMYTTNIIESVNSKFKKVTAGKRVFLTKESLLKCFYIWQLWSWNVNGPKLRIGHISTAR